MTDRGAGSGLLDLGDPACLRVEVAGGKASWLARGLAAGHPVLPGLVVPVEVSRPAMDTGVDALGRRGSGGARLEVSAVKLPAGTSEEIVARSADLADHLVVRSSSVLEGDAEWSGAFTSYLDVTPEEVPRAVAGCWASAFGVATLERHEAAGIAPGAAGMAVLVQRALDPDFGGTARLEDGGVVITAVPGSPAPLVQGWEPGVRARVSDETVSGDAALALMGETTLLAVAETMRNAGRVGADVFEWAVVGGEVVLLQLGATTAPPADTAEMASDDALGRPQASGLARLVRRFPGPLGESLVLPWAVGDPRIASVESEPLDMASKDALAAAHQHSAALTAEVWGLPKEAAAAAAARALRGLRGPDPGPVLEKFIELRRPDPVRAALVLGALATVRQRLAAAEAVTWPEVGWHVEPAEVAAILAGLRPSARRLRVGFDRWEPFGAAVTMAGAQAAAGAGAAPGVAFGRLRWMPTVGDMGKFRPRDVIVAPFPTQHLAALLWDAAGIVTVGGGPAAHLFESARALGIPAVASIHLEDRLGTSLAEADGKFALALDGGRGSVFAAEW